MALIKIVGAGQLGSRHLQALQSIRTPLDIHVIDPSPESLKVAEERFHAAAGETKHSVRFATEVAAMTARTAARGLRRKRRAVGLESTQGHEDGTRRDPAGVVGNGRNGEIAHPGHRRLVGDEGAKRCEQVGNRHGWTPEITASRGSRSSVSVHTVPGSSGSPGAGF